MDDQFKPKISSSLGIVAIILSIASLVISLSVYKNTPRFTQDQSADPTKEVANKPVAEQKDISNEEASGFVGLPISDIQEKDNKKTFAIQGHRLTKDGPVSYAVSKDERDKIDVVLSAETKIFKFQVPNGKDAKTSVQGISVSDFKIESRENPYLVVFSQPISGDTPEAVAKEIRILPVEAK